MTNNGDVHQAWIEHYCADGVTLEETDSGYGPVFILAEASPSKYVLKIVPSRKPEDGRYLSVVLHLEYSDKRPGERADYTFRSEDRQLDCAPGELLISDAGLLSAMVRQQTASKVVYHCGWTLQLPVAFVEPVRKAIALATAVLPNDVCV